MSDLKPCPFCGGEAKSWATPAEDHETGDIYSLYFVQCSQCQNKTSYSKESEWAEADWNRRTPEWRHREGPDYP